MAVAPPTLLSPAPDDKLPDLDREFCTWKRAIVPSIATAAFITTLALKFIDYRGMGSAPISGTILSFVAGASLQTAVQTALPRRFANQEKSFIADYLAPTFLIATQVYANTTPSPVAKSILFESMVGILGGMPTAALIHTVFFRKLREGTDLAPILTGDENTEKMEGIFFTSSENRCIWPIIEGLFGVASLVAGVTVSQLSLLRDFGIILTADGVGQLGSELAHRGISHASEGYKKTYEVTAKVFLSLATALPGILIVGAGSLEKNIYPLSAVLYACTGLTMGIKRHLERTRFFTSPRGKLRELGRKKQVLNLPEEVFRVFKWSIAPLTLAYLGLGIAGFNFANGKWDQYSDIGAIDLSTIGICLFGSYAVSELAKYLFKKNNAWGNEFYFYNRYALGPPIAALYLLEKMKIGDRSLIRYDLLKQVLSGVAYASLGVGVGQEAAVRGEFPHPRVMTALAAALVGKFIIRKMIGEV